MGSSVQLVLRRWARSWNRRRWVEELVRASAWAVGAVAVAAVLATSFGMRFWVVPPLLMFFGGLLLVSLVRALWRRTTPLALAYRVDAARGTADLMATALAVERGRVTGAGPLQEAVVRQAIAAAPA